MASVFSHAVAALGIGAVFYKRDVPKYIWVAGAACAAIPDLDVIGFAAGVPYGSFWGHRGFTHSLIFAALLASAVTIALFPHTLRGMSRPALGTYLFLATARHGVLDAMTDGGLGVAFFSPFDNRRYFFPLRPIRVSPIGIERFFSQRGWAVLESEFLWIWLPAATLIAVSLVMRREKTAVR